MQNPLMDDNFVQNTRMMKKVLKEPRPVKIKGSVVYKNSQAQAIVKKYNFNYVFEGDANTNEFTFSLYNALEKRQICEKQKCETNLFN